MTFNVDKEVQDFGPYKLVIRRKTEGTAYAVLWRGGEKLAYAEGNTKEEAFDELLRLLGIRQLELEKARGGKPLTADEVAMTFRNLWRHLTPSQQTMLRALCRAPHQEMTTQALADAVGFRGHNGVNLWLGLAGAMFANECPRAAGEMLVKKDGSPISTTWFADWDEAGNKWAMRPEVAEGMRLANCMGH